MRLVRLVVVVAVVRLLLVVILLLVVVILILRLVILMIKFKKLPLTKIDESEEKYLIMLNNYYCWI